VSLEPKKVIGLMSGTSCDSIDAGLCEVYPDLSCKLIKGINHPYPPHIKAKIFQIFRGEANIKDICQMNFAIGKCFADAANMLISEFGKPDMIASHGQTVYHYPFDEKLDGISLKSTLQIGESSVITQETGCMTISNFREADIAAGGQGAPLVCFADEKWFLGGQEGKRAGGQAFPLSPWERVETLNEAQHSKSCAEFSVSGEGFSREFKQEFRGGVLVQNIGGIANVTILSKECPTFGFDTGPGNLMIDYCTNKFFNIPYDKDGEIAKSGKVDESWLECLMQDEYYFKNPPKTTGREYFSPEYIERALKFAPADPKDIVATLTALTAKTIAAAYERFVYPELEASEVVVGGGGAYNPALMAFLRSYLPKNIELKTHEDYGISNNFKEVMAFALLGYCTYYGIPNNLPSCTGASRRVVLGKIVH